MREEGGKGAVLFAITLIALTSAAMAISLTSPAAVQSGEDSWAVKIGDNLTYEIAGSREGAQVTGAAYANFTEVNITGHGSMIGGFFFTDLGSWTGTGVLSGLSSPSLGFCLGQTSIRTDFGTKQVTKYISFHSDPDVNVTSVVMVYAGMESRIIYRINASAPTFFLGLDLRSATVAGLEQLDQNATRQISIDAIRPSEEGFTQIFTTPGGRSAGLWELPEGTVVNHSLEGNGSASYFFTEANIERMEHGGLLESDPAISILDPPDARSAVLGSGLYLAATDTSAAGGETREHYGFDYPA